jgi:HSP20 family protein
MGKDNALVVQRGNHALAKRLRPSEGSVTPSADIFETAEAFVIRLETPGATRESLNVTVEGHRLIVLADVEPRNHGGRKLASEIQARGYYREFHIGAGIDRNKVTAEYADGVLTVVLSKTEDGKTKHIPIL